VPGVRDDVHVRDAMSRSIPLRAED
jgi:hypothetical protein